MSRIWWVSTGYVYVQAMGHLLGYARVSTVDQVSTAVQY